MKKIALFVCLLLAACGGKSPVQATIDASIDRIERAEVVIKNAPTLEQCQTMATEILLSAKADIKNIGGQFESQIKNLKADVIRWQTYFWLLIVGLGVSLYIYIIHRIRKTLI